MDIIVERAAGLDVHKSSIAAAIIVSREGVRPKREQRTFGATRRDLEALAAWLAEHGITDVAMEATGVYWMPVYAALEGRFTLVVANAHHVRNVPGRKTDMNDARWLAELLRHGLIQPSFVPDRPQRERRVLTRERRGLVESRTRLRNEVLKLLESVDVKLAGVLTDVFGVSGTLMLRALVAGERDPAALAALAQGSLRKKTGLIEAALEGDLTSAHRLALELHLEQLDLIERQIATLEAAIETRLEPHRALVERLIEIPGVDRTIAAIILAEIGPEVSAFANAHRLAAWSGLCPGNHESAGRARSSRVRKGNVHLKTALVQAAMAASRCKGSYLHAKYHKLKPRLGTKRAAVAVAHKIVIALYHMLRGGVRYKDLGAAYLDTRDTKRTVRNLLRRLHDLGCHVTLQEAPTTANSPPVS